MISYPLGQYYGGRSLAHRLDPRLKVLLTVTLSLFILRMNLKAGLSISVFLVFWALTSQVPFRVWLKSLRPVAWLFALILFLHLFFTPGPPLFPLGIPFPWVTQSGLLRGSWLIWQFSLLLLSASLLTMTTRPSAFIMAMESLLSPLRGLGFPTHELALMISLALRFLPTFLEEIDRIKTAQQARGADFGNGNPIRRMKRMYSLALPVLIRLFQRADEVAVAMEARGYRRGPRTYLRELHWTALDSGAAVLSLGFFVLLYLMNP